MDTNVLNKIPKNINWNLQANKDFCHMVIGCAICATISYGIHEYSDYKKLNKN